MGERERDWVRKTRWEIRNKDNYCTIVVLRLHQIRDQLGNVSDSSARTEGTWAMKGIWSMGAVVVGYTVWRVAAYRGIEINILLFVLVLHVYFMAGASFIEMYQDEWG